MKSIETIVKIEKTDKNIFRFTFPEYPDCPEYADDDFGHALNVIPTFLAVYAILNNEGELTPHKCSLFDLYEFSGKAYYSFLNCDVDSTAELLKEMAVTADAFFGWAEEKTDSVIGQKPGSKKSEPVKKPEAEEKKPEPEKETHQGINVMETVKEQTRRSNDATVDLSDIVDDDIESDVLANKSNGRKPAPKKKKFDNKKKQNSV